MNEPAADDSKWQEWKEWKKRKQFEEFYQWRDGLGSQGNQRVTSGTESTGKDQTKYVLSGQPTGWAAMDKALRDYDDETVKDYKEDIDNLLTFTGLFSGVLASFLIESYPKLLANPSDQSSSDLRQPAAWATQGNLSSAAASPHSSPSFRPASGDIRVNVLWFASLLLSLTAASFGILVKQWLREYMSFKNPSPQARLRVRHLRYPNLDRWWVFQIAAFLPILVHLSLALFFIGLVYFTASIHTSIEYTTLPLVSAWGLCFLVFAGLPLFFPRCPYRITILKDIYAGIHWVIWLLSDGAKDWITKHHPSSLSKASQPEPSVTMENWTYRDRITRQWCAVWKRITTRWWTFWDWLFGEVAHACKRVDEADVARSENKDLKVLSDADDIQSNDELLNTEIVEAARQVDLKQSHPHAAPKFIHELLCNRMAIPQGDDDNYFSLILNLEDTTLSSQAKSAIVGMILDFIPKLPSSREGFPDMTSKSEDLRREIEALKPRLLFALLLCLSGHPLSKVPLLGTHLSQQKRGREITSLCRMILAQPSSHDHTKHDAYKIAEPPDTMRINLLRGISLVHRAVEARWGLTQALRSVGPTTAAYPQFGDDDYTIAPHPPDSLIRAQEYMTSLGSRAMHYVLFLESWTGKLDRRVVYDILQSLCDEVRNRTLRRRSQAPDATPQDPAPGGVLMVDLITLDSLVTYICFQLWRPQWFRLEKCWTCLLTNLISRAESRTLTLAICCVPTTGVLRLCWRAASHSHSSGTQVIRGLDLRTLSNFDGVLDNGLRYDLVRNNPMNILKLLSFSLYLYTFSTSRLLDIPKAEKQAWAKIFNKFTTSVQGLQLDSHHSRCKQPACRHRNPWSALATVCLEMIRFEEILARIMRRYVEDLACEQLKDYSTFRYTSDRTVNMQVVDGWKSTPLCSVFSEGLITALEKLAEPSWFDPISNTGHSAEIQFHDYCIAYEERIRDIVKIKATDTWSWLRGYCSHSSRRR